MPPGDKTGTCRKIYALLLEKEARRAAGSLQSFQEICVTPAESPENAYILCISNGCMEMPTRFTLQRLLSQ
jgi:hypothetical protein